ncbi:hypothetical protein Bbelb_112170 [Branchiostoma belcheri]|nr:hypothetical protein Bbelb_112170 [Branchiostoma belcheri]
MTPFLTWAAKGRHPPRRRLRRRPVTSPLTRWGGRAGQSHRVNTFPVLGGIRAQPPAHASAPPTPAAACIAKVLFPRRRHGHRQHLVSLRRDRTLYKEPGFPALERERRSFAVSASSSSVSARRLFQQARRLFQLVVCFSSSSVSARRLFQLARRLFQLVVCFSKLVLVVCFSSSSVSASSLSVSARRLFQQARRLFQQARRLCISSSSVSASSSSVSASPLSV